MKDKELAILGIVVVAIAIVVFMFMFNPTPQESKPVFPTTPGEVNLNFSSEGEVGEITNETNVTTAGGESFFEEQKGSRRELYGIKSTPAIVFNCRYTREGTYVLKEQQGLVPNGTELDSLEKLTCMFNNGEPKEVCTPLGIVNVNGTIKPPGGRQLMSGVSKTGQESCKPDEMTTLVEVFHSRTPASVAQEKVIQKLNNIFSGSVKFTFYCIGTAQECAGAYAL